MLKNKWDKRFFDLCNHISEWSEDQSRKVGAVIVGAENVILSTGYNGLPRGISNSDPTRHDKETGLKYFWYEHAERNAIYNAARQGIAIQGSKIFCNLFPCAECARAIVQSGIIELKTKMPDLNDRTYKKSFEISLIILNEASVKVSFLD